MKKIGSVLVLMLMCLAMATVALAAGTRIEEIQYKGFGVIRIDFTRDCRWYPDAKFTLRGADAEPYDAIVLGGEEDEAYLFVRDLPENAEYDLIFELDGEIRELSFTAVTGTEFHFGPNGITEIIDNDRCDICREVGHDDDFCPKRFGNVELPEDPAQLARMFDIDPLPDR